MNYKDFKQDNHPSLINKFEDFWNELVTARMQCPYCEQYNDMLIEITKKHTRIDCKNPSCSKVFMYRRISLGAIE